MPSGYFCIRDGFINLRDAFSYFFFYLTALETGVSVNDTVRIPSIKVVYDFGVLLPFYFCLIKF